MAELLTSTTAAVTGAAGAAGAGAAMAAAIWPEADISLLSGVFCGALVFLLRSREPSRLKKVLYFAVSLIGGYAVTPTLLAAAGWLPMWLAAFISSALLVAVSMVAIDWAESNLAQLLTRVLNRLLDRVLGGGKND